MGIQRIVGSASLVDVLDRVVGHGTSIEARGAGCDRPLDLGAELRLAVSRVELRLSHDVAWLPRDRLVPPTTPIIPDIPPTGAAPLPAPLTLELHLSSRRMPIADGRSAE